MSDFFCRRTDPLFRSASISGKHAGSRCFAWCERIHFCAVGISILSEFPEKVSAFHWARQPKKAPMALMNMVSSNINQWTMLIAMIPVVYSYGIGSASAIHFDLHQKEEILLTLAQAFVGFMLLLNMSFSWYEAAGLFILWLAQFIQPHWRVEITYVYFAWFGIEVIRLFGSNRSLPALTHFGKLFKQHVLGK